jgi:galactan 5-O-arabinofuranosyltransferase
MEFLKPAPKGLRAILQPKVVISLTFGLTFYLLVGFFEGATIRDYPFGALMPETALIVASLLAIGAMWWFQGKPWSFYLLMHICALGFGAATLLAWCSYSHACGGVSSDAWFSTAIVSKYKGNWGSTDFGYKGLHSFYPSLYQFVVAKLAAFSGTTGIKGMKYGVYWTAYLLPLAAYGLWRKFLDELPAFLIVLAAMMICRTNLAFKPYEVIALNVFIPWALYYVAGIRREIVDGESKWLQVALSRKEILTGGIIGGLCFMTFYYYFFLLVVWLPLQWLVAMGSKGSVKEQWLRFRGFLGVVVVMMAVSAVYWAPLLGDMMRFGAVSFQNRWFAHHMFGLPFDISNQWKTLLGLLLLIGMAPRNALAKTVLVMLVAILGYILLGHFTMYLDFPLLHFRMVGMEEYLLNLGLILGAIQLMRRLKSSVEPIWEKMVPVALMGVYFMGMGMGFMWEKGRDSTIEAAKATLPDLINVPSFSDFSKDKVFLTNQQSLAAYRSLFLFIVPNAHYSHPAGRYRDRLKFLVLLSKSQDSDFISWMLQYNRYDKVDFVSLKNNHMDVSDDNFPEPIPHIGVAIQFQPDAFEGEYFQRDPGFQEIIHVLPMAPDHWKKFTPEQQKLVAMFSDQDREEVRAGIPAATVAALEDELRIRTWDYVAWQRVFWFKYLGGW